GQSNALPAVFSFAVAAYERAADAHADTVAVPARSARASRAWGD
ncbi:DUF2471 family protein, partial [Burkholderia pseudomallei]